MCSFSLYACLKTLPHPATGHVGGWAEERCDWREVQLAKLSGVSWEGWAQVYREAMRVSYDRSLHLHREGGACSGQGVSFD